MITARSFLTNAQFSLTCWTRHKQASRKSQDHRDRRSCSLSIYISRSLPLSGERRSRVWAARVTRSWLRTRAAVSREQRRFVCGLKWVCFLPSSDHIASSRWWCWWGSDFLTSLTASTAYFTQDFGRAREKGVLLSWARDRARETIRCEVRWSCNMLDSRRI